MTTGVGLVGFGLAGRILHAPIIRCANMQIRAVVSSRIQQIQDDFPDADQYADIEPMLQRDDIDLVVLATPNELHFPQAMAALKHGKHVVIDKPFTITSDEAQTLINTAGENDRKLSVYHNRRWDADFLTIQSLLEQGQIGEITTATLRWDRWRPEPTDRWRDQQVPGAGMLYDLGPHLIDQAILLIGKPDWLQASVYAQRPGAVIDDGFELLMAKDRTRVAIGVNSVSADTSTHYIINGTRATFRKSWLDPQEGQLREGMSPLNPKYGIESERNWGTLHYPDGTQMTVASSRGKWLSFYEGMRDAIESNAPVPVDPASALYVMQIIEAAFESEHQQKRIPLDHLNAP